MFRADRRARLVVMNQMTSMNMFTFLPAHFDGVQRTFLKNSKIRVTLMGTDRGKYSSNSCKQLTDPTDSTDERL